MKRPTDTACPVCEAVFQQPRRSQGGGKRTIYCSARCRSLDWTRGNGAKRKASILKYESVPENKVQRRVYAWRRLLAGYGWTPADFDRQIERQGDACAGCLASFSVENPPKIDHCHTTKRNRGLLCNACNLALGCARDQPQTLRRLMAYLDRDIATPLVYLIGALKNPRIPHVGNALRSAGFDVMDEWFTPGEHADTNWQAYERLRGRSYAEALRGRSATNTFMFDRSYIDLADAVVFVAPAGKSAMLELGYSAARGKHTVLFLDGADPDRYDVMTHVVRDVYRNEREMLDSLVAWRDSKHWPSRGGES